MTDATAVDFLVRQRAARRRGEVDGWTGEVMLELRASGIRSILLKGPAIVSWLYGQRSRRAYLDSDLLVHPDELARAEQCLSAIGFRNHLKQADAPWAGAVGDQWTRPADGAVVDLHVTLDGVGVAPPRVWRVLSGRTESMKLGEAEVEVLDVPARALHVALHAAQHGDTQATAQDDLALALESLDLQTWRAAASLAEELDATGSMAVGLRLHPSGERRADELRLPRHVPVQLALKAGAPRNGAGSIEFAASRRGVVEMARVAVRILFPNRRFMQVWWPPSRAGRSWLLTGYLRRIVYVGRRSGAAWLLWLRTRANARRRSERLEP